MFRVVLVTDVLLQLDHVSGTTYLPVCETTKSAAQSSEDNWKHSCFRRTAARRDFLITAPYKYSYLLTYTENRSRAGDEGGTSLVGHRGDNSSRSRTEATRWCPMLR